LRLSNNEFDAGEANKAKLMVGHLGALPHRDIPRCGTGASA
jgi:hypothetical protein